MESQNNNKIRIGHIDIHVTEHCSLRCKDCNAGIPYIKEPRHYSVEELSFWFKKMFELIDWTENVNLMGGEFLLHPETVQLCKELYRYRDKYPEMRILTNATIVPNDELLEYICEIIANGCKFLFYLDNYGEKLSKNLINITKKLEKYNIAYRITNYAGDSPDFGGWVDYRMYNVPESKGYDENLLNRVFNGCWYFKSGGTFILKNGSIYPCVFPMTHEFFGRRSPFTDEKIDLSNETLSLEEKREIAKSFRKRIVPFDSCAYCPGLWDGAARVQPAVQLYGDINKFNRITQKGMER